MATPKIDMGAPATDGCEPVTAESSWSAAVGQGGGVLRSVQIGALELETGGLLTSVTVAFECWGTLNAAGTNAVLIQHALTGSTHVSRGDSEEDGWWEGLVGPGEVIDTNKYFVLCANMLGGCYGSTGPSSIGDDGVPYGSRFPFVTIRDSVNAEAKMADRLGITSWHAVIGGSMGGARALEWAITFPERVHRCAVVAACAASTAEQIAFAQAQVLAIRQDPNFAGGDYYDDVAPTAGLGLARRIAHITYRSEAEMGQRFGRAAQDGENPVSGKRLPSKPGRSRTERYRVESYLDHQAHKLVGRFDANSYIVITEALMSHDVTRGRGTLKEALYRAQDVEFLVAAVNSDRLYFPAQSEELAAALPGENTVRRIDSPIGHDGFLTEVEAVGNLLKASFFPV
ncbi:homoserine O-acetyltransferase MetX [Arthrobacter cryoconiti]|uniref:Homoserine O-acetyltransferase n=1 Tax=Arthrobacter cryoconiti TaxID=748907 RepID=A0ABV8R2V6_9MICC|nr:homoserine O-acetyltransferase [Arthrobacter cryoconiti]MCC9067134.1 homoserine O-acetyltransferase [Arthrobacter cryoconiti]